MCKWGVLSYIWRVVITELLTGFKFTLYSKMIINYKRGASTTKYFAKSIYYFYMWLKKIRKTPKKTIIIILLCCLVAVMWWHVHLCSVQSHVHVHWNTWYTGKYEPETLFFHEWPNIPKEDLQRHQRQILNSVPMSVGVLPIYQALHPDPITHITDVLISGAFSTNIALTWWWQ